MISEVSERTGIAVDDILGRSRAVLISCARQLYWKLLRERKRFTYREIAELNDRDLSSIYEGIKQANELLESGDQLACSIWDKIKTMKA